MLELVWAGSADIRSPSASIPGAEIGLIICFFLSAHPQVKVFIIIVKRSTTTILITPHCNDHPSILGNSKYLLADKITAVQVNQFKKIAVIKTEINGIEDRISAHDLCKNCLCTLGYPIIVAEAGIIGQKGCSLTSLVFNGIQILAGSDGTLLIERERIL